MTKPLELFPGLETPALLLDLDRLEKNIDTMAEKAAALGVSLRPHIKTHKCVEIARMQLAAGASGITVSTLYEAEVFAAAGFDDITWAFPIPLSRIERAGALAQRIRFHVVADSHEAVDALIASGHSFSVLLKIDTGYHRAGIDPGDPLVTDLAGKIYGSTQLTFGGILSHCGHSYDATTQEERQGVAETDRALMAGLSTQLASSGLECVVVSVGSTPSMSAVENLGGITEARPGNYALFDYSMVERGVCTAADCAATVLASVISSPVHGSHCVVDAGALSLSKDGSFRPGGGLGRLVSEETGGLAPSGKLFSLSQEHGKLDLKEPVGQQFRVLPNHSCLAVACHDEFVVVRAGVVVDRWSIWRGR